MQLLVSFSNKGNKILQNGISTSFFFRTNDDDRTNMAHVLSENMQSEK